MTAAFQPIPVVLPDGTEIGYIEKWGADPGIFNGWVKLDTASSEIAIEGVAESVARLAVIRAYLVQEIKAEQERGLGGQDAEQTPRIRAALRMQKEITEEVWKRQGLTLPGRKGPQT